MRISSSTTSNFKRTPKLCHFLHSAPEEQMKEPYTAGPPMSRAIQDMGLVHPMSSASPANLCILTRVQFSSTIVLLLGVDGQRPTGGGRLSTGGGQSTPRVTEPTPPAHLQRDGIEYLDPVFNQKLDSRAVPGDLGVPGAKEPKRCQ